MRHLAALGKMLDFCVRHFFKEKENLLDDSNDLLSLESKTTEEVEEIKNLDNIPKLNISEKTIPSRLYMIEQSITSFKDIFPDKYNEFMEKIEFYKADYEEALANSGKALTFEIDPDLNYTKQGEVINFEREIQNFIKKEVKGALIIKKLERLIVKLNILFNVSIWYSNETDKQKGLKQLSHARESEIKIINEFKNADFIVGDLRFREEILNLISYLDYLIFKLYVKYSNGEVSTIFNDNPIVSEFKGFDTVSMFKAFVKDELYEMEDFLNKISDENYKNVLKRNYIFFVNFISDEDGNEDFFIFREFWNNFFEFEFEVLNFLKGQGISKDDLNIEISSKFNISINENELISLPKVNSILTLTSTYYKTGDIRLLILNLMFKNFSENITYKEIYFLFLLFDVLDMVNLYPNEISSAMKKYSEKYPYTSSDIKNKKRQVMAMPNKIYFYVFDIEEYEDKILDTMSNFDFDFKVEEGKVYLNSFYFNGLDNIIKSLEKNTL